MVARRKNSKKNDATSPTRELFSDDLTQAETQTTRAQQPEKPQPQPQTISTPLYLERRPVKFINVPVGGRFLMNGGNWTKSTPDFATPDSDTYSVLKIDPATFVFPLEGSRQ